MLTEKAYRPAASKKNLLAPFALPTFIWSEIITGALFVCPLGLCDLSFHIPLEKQGQMQQQEPAAQRGQGQGQGKEDSAEIQWNSDFMLT